MNLISEEQLNAFRLEGTRVRVVRDHVEVNDVTGIIVAWDESHVMVRRPNRRIVKLSRMYTYEAASEDRGEPFQEGG